MRRALWLLCIATIHAWANPVVIEASDYWECHVSDSADKQWLAQGSYQRIATNKAFEACKKQSEYPNTCKAANEACEAFVNGISTRPMWRCTALDQLSKVWRSAIYTHRDDAALGAKAYCHQHSGMPDSCYINLMMCKNLNER